jgi:hypothetical protein
MTLREYIEGRNETLKQFCARVRIPTTRGLAYFYRRRTKMNTGDFLRDLNVIRAATNGLVDADGITNVRQGKGKVTYIGRGRPPKEVNEKTIGKKKTGKVA